MINRAIEILQEKYKINLRNLFIEDIRIGVFMTGIKLSDNSYGLAGSHISQDSQAYRDKRDFDNFSTNNIIGKSINELLSVKKETAIISGLRVAALNALSAKIIKNNFKIIENKDPIDMINIANYNNITIVGAFQSYIRKLKERNKNFSVLELDKNALRKEDYKYFAKAETYKEVFEKSDLIIITGSTLVNNTLSNLLKNISKEKTVIITGPSGSIVPDVLFENGVDIIGATNIIDSEKMFELVSQAATGFHFFKYACAQKICIVNPNSTIYA